MLLVVLVMGMDHLLYTGLDHSPCLSPSETFHGTGGGGGGGNLESPSLKQML